MRITFLVLTLLLNTAFITAQETRKIDSTFRISYVDKLIIKANLDTRTNSYIINYSDANSDFTISTNTNLRMFLSLDYEFIGASIGFAPSFFTDNKDDDIKGKSSYTDFQFRFFLGQWVQGLHYSEVEGFYVENTGDFVPGWMEGEDPYIQFPNLKRSSYGMTTSYVFNKRFSYRNITYQTEWQKKSAGSFVPTLHYNFNRLSFSTEDLSSTEDFYNIRLSLAYYYTFVINEHWFIAPFISPSLGIRFSHSESTDNGITTSSNDTYFMQNLDGGLQLGYSSKRVIFGLNANSHVFWHQEDHVTAVTENSFYGLVYFGYRFDAPRFVKNTFDWFYDTFKIPR